MPHQTQFVVLLALLSSLGQFALAADAPDLILHHAKVVTVDKDFTIRQALAIKDGRIVAVGTSEAILAGKGPDTRLIDLGGKTILPGLIDSHTHPTGAAMTEFDHPIPDMESIADVLAYVKSRAVALEKGQWVEVHQVFITRLKEQRYPTRAELDAAAPDNPVLFATGPDASLNTLALKLSNITRDFKVDDGGPGYAEKDKTTGEPTGILRSCTRYVKVKSAAKEATEADRRGRLLELFADYNSVGITAICDRDAGRGDIDRYQALRDAGKLTLRLSVSHHVDTIGPLDKIQQRIRDIAKLDLRKDDPLLRVIGIKTYLDGGMLTGSAYMRQPWGVSDIYSITDPQYRGVLFIPRERLLPIVRTTVESGLQFTAHSVGDGAVHTLLEVYDEINKTQSIRETRPCITHSNFMSKEAVEQCAKLGVMVDIQPAWLYLDTRTLVKQFGNDRLRYFQPLKSLFEAGVTAGGGSDHMQKIGSFRSINPYNPWLGMQTTITRRARWFDGQLHPEEALIREQAIRFYTINNARLLFRDHQTGSLEPGKFADFIVTDLDPLTCPEETLKETRVLATYVSGRKVFSRE
jgi:predicted amidohydrolase YtcJ